MFALWLSIFKETELASGLTIVDAHFTAIAVHQSVFEFSFLDILDGLMFRFVVTVSSKIDDSTKSIHRRFNMIELQLSDMESLFHGDFIRLHDKILLLIHMDAIDKEVNVAVEGSFISLDILLFMDLDMSYFLPAAQVQMLNVELVDLIGKRVFLSPLFALNIANWVEYAAAVDLVLVHDTHFLKSVTICLVFFHIWLL